MKRALAFALALTVVAISPAARAGDAAPAYEVPAGAELPRLAPSAEEAVGRAVATILDPPTADAAEDAVRMLAGAGRGALPQIVRGLAPAGWRSRAALVAACAEMDAPDATPLLVAASRDPSFAVREAAVSGLGKTGDARGAAALLERASQAEPVWRVRAAAAAALRRGVLRGSLGRAAGEAAMVRLLDDADQDVRRAALREIAPLAAESALAPLLGIFTTSEDACDRTMALAALRSYRSAKPELVAALRRAVLGGGDEVETQEAGRALLAIAGVGALADAELASAVVHRLHEGRSSALREGLVRLGRPVAPWLREQALAIAVRVASGREQHGDTAFDELRDTLLQVDEAAGVDLLKDLLFGPRADTFDLETRLSALRKVELVYAPRMGAELRTLFADRAGSDLRSEVLRSVVASGGDDLAPLLDGVLGGPTGKLRRTALDLLDNHPDLAAGPNLRRLASEAAEPAERRAALETLSRRDAAGAAALAGALLGDPRPEMRSKAISLLTASKDPADFDRIAARLSVEDGSEPPRPAPPPDAAAGTTPSERATSTLGRRRLLRKELIRAARTTGGARARPVLLALLADDPDEATREVAAIELRGIVRAADAPKLLAAEQRATDPTTRQEVLRTLATLADAPEAVARFEALVGDMRSRDDTVKLLAEKSSSVVTSQLAPGLAGSAWTDDVRLNALVALERAGRGPPPAELASLVAGAPTLELANEAARFLSERPGDEATRELLALTSRVTEPGRLAAVLENLGARRAPEAEPVLLALFEKTRAKAMAAEFATDPTLAVYQRCADALAAYGSQRTGEALASHLLDPRLARAATRLATWVKGPFDPDTAAPAAIVRTLVRAFARRDEAACRRLLASQLGTLTADLRDVALSEPYVAGLARYLQSPASYGLPPRPRPAAADLLWDLVLRTAPRMSPFDMVALQARDDHLGELGRYREAAAALTAYRDLANVEKAARPNEEVLLDTCRIQARTAQALAAEGRADDALALARKLREPDANSGELAYRTGWCLVRIGRAPDEAKEALRFALAQDDRDPRIHFLRAWLAQTTEGAEASLAWYAQAVKLDRKRFIERTDDEPGYHGRSPESGAYPYWFARALRAAGDDEGARSWLEAAIPLDDRLAAQALADPAFAGLAGLEESVAAGLARVGARISQ